MAQVIKCFQSEYLEPSNTVAKLSGFRVKQTCFKPFFAFLNIPLTTQFHYSQIEVCADQNFFAGSGVTPFAFGSGIYW